MATPRLIDDFFRGDTVDWTIYETDEDGARVDIAGFRYAATLKSDLDDPDDAALWQIVVDVPDDQGLINEWPMVVKCEPASTDTPTTPPDHNRDTPAGRYWFDLTRILAGDPPHRRTVARQRVKCLKDVTRSL